MRLFFTLLLTLSIAPLSAQLYNGNFENWISFHGALLLQGWEIYAYNDNTSVTQDMDAYEGMYAARIEAIPIELGAYGNASTIFSIDEIPASLEFYVKTASEFGGVSVEIIFYNGEETVDTFSWSSAEEEIEDWTFVSIPIEQDLPEVNTARVNINAQVGDFAPGSAVISVDQMTLGTTTSLYEKDLKVLHLFPNPAVDVVRLERATDIERLEIIDMNGRIVENYMGSNFQNEISVRHLQPACYAVIAYLKSGQIARQQLVIAR